MAYGLKTYNTSGALVIDSTEYGRISYSYHDSGSFIANGGTYSNNGYYEEAVYGTIDVPYTTNASSSVIVFVRPKNTPTTTLRFFASLDPADYSYFRFAADENCDGVEFEWISFLPTNQSGTQSNAFSTGYGLEVQEEILDANNNGTGNFRLQFSSNFLSCRLRGVISRGAEFTEAGAYIQIQRILSGRSFRAGFYSPPNQSYYAEVQLYAEVCQVDTSNTYTVVQDLIYSNITFGGTQFSRIRQTFSDVSSNTLIIGG